MAIDPLYERAKIILDRLERLSADSTWAHRASGLRGSLIRALDEVDPNTDEPASPHIAALVEQGFRILILAAQEIPDLDDH